MDTGVRKRRLNANDGRNDFKMLLHQPLLLATILLIFALLLLFIIIPILNILKLSFAADGRLDLTTCMKVLRDKGYQRTFWNSMELGAIVAVLSTAIGYAFAFAITRTEMRCKAFFRGMATLPIISPPFIICLSLIFLFGRQGLITHGLLHLNNFDVYGLKSLVLVQVISSFPVAFLTLTGILESIDTSVEDAAYNMGASRWHIFRTITLPLSLPGIASALLLVFIQSLEDFSNPAVIAGSFSTLSVEAYQLITGMYDTAGGAMLSLVLLLPTLCAFLLQRFWLKGKSFVTVTGKPTQKRRQLYERHIIWPLFTFCMLVTLVIVVFYGTVLVGAFVKTWGVDYSFTLDHFAYVWDIGRRALNSTILLAAISAPLGGLLGMVIAYLTVRKRFFGKRVMEISSLLTFAIPGTVLGIAYITTFNTKPMLLTGTATILVAAFVFRNMPVAIESGSATLMQIDRSVEEASAILGADSGQTFFRVTLPLLRQAFFSGLVFAFVRSVTAVSTIIFLVSPQWDLATRKVFGLFENSKYSDAAAYVLIMIAVILVAIGIITVLVSWLLAPRAKRQRQGGTSIFRRHQHELTNERA